jgi:hypothetical protein
MGWKLHGHYSGIILFVVMVPERLHALVYAANASIVDASTNTVFTAMKMTRVTKIKMGKRRMKIK